MHMTGSIHFPNLGIHLENVGQSISVFGFEIAFYGIIIGIGIISGILLAAHLAKKTGMNVDIIYDVALYAVFFSVVGARLYYVIFSWDLYKDNLWSIFNLREGGLAIYGAVIAAIITVYTYTKIKKISFMKLADVGAPALILGQILGRWGNFFNREAFGGYTDGLLAMQLPIDAVRSSDVTKEMMRHLEVIDGISYIQVHPTFLYESLWNLAVLGILLWWMKYKKFDGEIFLMYLFGYGVGRFWIEGLRTDQLLIGNTNIAVSQVLALVLAIVSGVAIWYMTKKTNQTQSKESVIEMEDTIEENSDETASEE